MTVFEHLGELRRRLIISIVAVAVAGTLVFIFAPEIISWLITFYNDAVPRGHAAEVHLHRPARRLRHPAEDRDLRRHRAGAAGLALAAVAVHHPGPEPDREEVRDPVHPGVDRPVRDGRGRRAAHARARPPVPARTSAGPTSSRLLTADKYISLVSLMILAFGLSFEFPVVLVFLLIARVLTTRAAAAAGAATRR